MLRTQKEAKKKHLICALQKYETFGNTMIAGSVHFSIFGGQNSKFDRTFFIINNYTNMQIYSL